MKQFLAFVSKEFYHILRDPRTLMILLGMPIVEMIIFGFALNMEVSNLRVVLMDQSGDKFSRELISKLSHNPYFDYKGYVSSYEQIQSMLKRDHIDLAIVTSKDTERRLIDGSDVKLQIILDGSDPNYAKIAYSYVAGILEDMDNKGAIGENLNIDVNSHMLYNPLLKSSYNFVPGLMGLVLVIICVVMTSVSIVREKERGSMEVLLASPIVPTLMILAKTVPYLLISFVNLISILSLSYLVLGVPISGSLWGIFMLTLCYVFLSLCIGMFISTIVQNQVQAIILSGFGMMMPTLILSGMIFPIENMPAFLRYLSWTVPARWYIDGVKRVMIQGLSLLYVWKELLILASMAIGLFTLSVFNVKSRLQ